MTDGVLFSVEPVTWEQKNIKIAPQTDISHVERGFEKQCNITDLVEFQYASTCKILLVYAYCIFYEIPFTLHVEPSS